MTMIRRKSLIQSLLLSIHSAVRRRTIYLRSTAAAGGHRISPQEDSGNIKDCYRILGVSSESSNNDVKEAYLRLAKQHHPDSGTQFADAKVFVGIDNAYRKVMDHRKRIGVAPSELEVVVYDIKHTAPQHRQYLTFEGVGYGTPSQRQHQYQHDKAMKAIDSVYEYRTQQISVLHENSLVIKEKKETKKHVIRNAIDRLVEDLIAESMAKGDFDNLPGTGKPLPHTNHNPYIDTMTHNLNRILINNGYVPEWVTIEREIREMLAKARDDLLEARAKTSLNWSKKVAEFRESINSVNQKINKLNMVVPTLRQQMVHYDANRELEKILKQHEELRKNSAGTDSSVSDTSASSFRSRSLISPTDKLTLNIVLKELKALFNKS